MQRMAKRGRKNRKRSRRGSSVEAVGAGGAVGAERDPRFHFTVGSLPKSGAGPGGGFFDFERELDLLKAALLYADRVKLCSVGASFMSALDDLGNMDLDGKLAMIDEYLPIIEPDATPEQLENTRHLMAVVRGSRGGRGRRRFGPQEMFAARKLLDDGWKRIEGRVQEEYRGVGAAGFREALRSGLVELQPFGQLSAGKLLRMGMSEEHGLPNPVDSDKTYDEYAERILEAVGDDETYPLPHRRRRRPAASTAASRATSFGACPCSSGPRSRRCSTYAKSSPSTSTLSGRRSPGSPTRWLRRPGTRASPRRRGAS